MIPRYGFNKCLISEFSFNVFVQYHNRLLGLELYSRREFESSILDKGQGRREDVCAFHEDREFLLSAIVY